MRLGLDEQGVTELMAAVDHASGLTKLAAGLRLEPDVPDPPPGPARGLVRPLDEGAAEGRVGAIFAEIRAWAAASLGIDHVPALWRALGHHPVYLDAVWRRERALMADGAVTRAGYDAGGGNMVCVKHVMSFETCYLHLSKILVKNGTRVAQKDVIGESGTTGLSTGPHLHFAMKRGGNFVNPLNQNFPRADPLPKALLPDFKEKIADLQAQLDASSVALRTR